MVALLPEPMKHMERSTSGSAATTALMACWRSTMAGKEMSCAASEKPVIRPVSCCGKRPLGMITKR